MNPIAPSRGNADPVRTQNPAPRPQYLVAHHAPGNNLHARYRNSTEALCRQGCGGGRAAGQGEAGARHWSSPTAHQSTTEDR